MDCYIDIQVLPDPEFPAAVLMNALYAKLHRALGQVAQGKVGTSFPHYGKTLGDVLRLHGAATDLDKLMAAEWLKGLRDYTQCSDILTVPATVCHRHVRRVQAKSSAERLRRRAVKRHGLDDAQVLERIPDKVERRVALPFVSIQSRSTGQRFRLFIKHGELQDSPSAGLFSSYGLSQHTTIPWF